MKIPRLRGISLKTFLPLKIYFNDTPISSSNISIKSQQNNKIKQEDKLYEEKAHNLNLNNEIIKRTSPVRHTAYSDRYYDYVVCTQTCLTILIDDLKKHKYENMLC